MSTLKKVGRPKGLKIIKKNNINIDNQNLTYINIKNKDINYYSTIFKYHFDKVTKRHNGYKKTLNLLKKNENFENMYSLAYLFCTVICSCNEHKFGKINFDKFKNYKFNFEEELSKEEMEFMLGKLKKETPDNYFIELEGDYGFQGTLNFNYSKKNEIKKTEFKRNDQIITNIEKVESNTIQKNKIVLNIKKTNGMWSLELKYYETNTTIKIYNFLTSYGTQIRDNDNSSNIYINQNVENESGYLIVHLVKNLLLNFHLIPNNINVFQYFFLDFKSIEMSSKYYQLFKNKEMYHILHDHFLKTKMVTLKK